VGDSNKERGQKRSPNRVIERKKEKKTTVISKNIVIKELLYFSRLMRSPMTHLFIYFLHGFIFEFFFDLFVRYFVLGFSRHL
jgi:hypothetical protein